MTTHVTENIRAIRQDIAAHATGPVRLVAVTKFATPAQVVEAWQAGIRDFGENRLQVAEEKMSRLPAEVMQSVDWHFIGHLQKNKVNKVVGRFAWIHSVDSAELACAINARAESLGIIQPVLCQVNISGEESKSGFSPEAITTGFGSLLTLANLRIDGLMTMAPQTDQEARIRETFQKLKDLQATLETRHGVSLPERSMGMSNDYVHALIYGATILRLGSRIFNR
ncbi:MAG: YggS family pyridoxal phosphate-dependent enzyme [Candidatus Melainabacteria bacterium]